jgi:hypothetical protein
MVSLALFFCKVRTWLSAKEHRRTALRGCMGGTIWWMVEVVMVFSLSSDVLTVCCVAIRKCVVIVFVCFIGSSEIRVLLL